MDSLVWFIGGVAAVALLYGFAKGYRGSTSATRHSPTSPAVARIRGNGRYSVEVVGESHYHDNFRHMLGARAGTDDEMHGDAVLRLEDDNPHDDHAVAVYVESKRVGYLSRDMARQFRAALKRDGLTKHQQVAVGCRVYCGGDDETFSVSLDLPET